MTVRWITPDLGTAPASDVEGGGDLVLIDVREFVDRAGNNPEALHTKIRAGAAALSEGRKVVVCCDHGISRSNAVAAGILSLHEHISLDDAVRRVTASTGETELRLDVVTAVRRALAGSQTTHPARDGKRWLLTGGHGYLGSLLAASAPPDIKLVRPDRSTLDLMAGSVALDLFVRDQGISRILHFASPRVGNTNTALAESLTMLRNLMEVAANQSVPLFLPSRWEVFGGYREALLTANEETALRPAGILGDTKFLQESLVRTWSEQGLAEVTIFRSGLVFGQGSAPNFIRNYIRKAVSGTPIVTHVYENGEPLLDLMSAGDWADACWALLRSTKTGIFQAGGGGLTGTGRIAEMIAMLCGRECKIEQLSIEGKAANVRLDFGKLSHMTGWQPSRPVEEQLADFIGMACRDRTFG